MVQRRYVTVDVFTAAVFGGNPLAVVLDAEGLQTAQMQSIAAEFNYSETTFVLPPREKAHAAQVRIFTPRTEIAFAGHPTVGTAVVLARELEARGASPPADLVLEEGVGPVSVRLMRSGRCRDRGGVSGSPSARAGAARIAGGCGGLLIASRRRPLRGHTAAGAVGGIAVSGRRSRLA